MIRFFLYQVYFEKTYFGITSQFYSVWIPYFEPRKSDRAEVLSKGDLANLIKWRFKFLKQRAVRRELSSWLGTPCVVPLHVCLSSSFIAE